MAEDILEDKEIKDLVEEFDKVDAEETVTPESTLEEKVAVDPDEPSRELPETDSSDAPPEEVDSEESEQNTEVADDLDQQLSDLADIYGMPPEVLAGRFSSVEDAKAAISLLEQSYASSGEPEEFVDYEPEEGELYQQDESQSRRPASAKPSRPVDREWSKLSLDGWDDDDDLPKNLKGLDRNTRILQDELLQMREIVGQLYQKEQASVYGETMERLNSIVDREGSELFGSGDELTPTQEKNRLKLFENADYLVAGMRQRGVDLPTEEQLIDRAMQLAFKTELGKERALGRASSRRPRDSRRLGVPSRGTEKSVTDMAMQHGGPLEENQAFLDLYKRLEEEN